MKIAKARAIIQVLSFSLNICPGWSTISVGRDRKRLVQVHARSPSVSQRHFFQVADNGGRNSFFFLSFALDRRLRFWLLSVRVERRLATRCQRRRVIFDVASNDERKKTKNATDERTRFRRRRACVGGKRVSIRRRRKSDGDSRRLLISVDGARERSTRRRLRRRGRT